EQLKTNLPSLAAGSYYLIVQVDRRNQIAEGANESNNLAVSASKIAITIPTLTVGTPFSDSFAAAGDTRYYQVSGQPGQTMPIEINSAATSGSVDIFVRYNGLATPYDYDFKSVGVSDPSPFVVIPSVRAGTYSILVRADAGAAATSGFTITATLP